MGFSTPCMSDSQKMEFHQVSRLAELEAKLYSWSSR
jgi:hypothetical protein